MQMFHDLTSVFEAWLSIAVLEINYMEEQKEEAERSVSRLLRQSRQKMVSSTGLGLVEVMSDGKILAMS